MALPWVFWGSVFSLGQQHGQDIRGVVTKCLSVSEARTQILTALMRAGTAGPTWRVNGGQTQTSGPNLDGPLFLRLPPATGDPSLPSLPLVSGGCTSSGC